MPTQSAAMQEHTIVHDGLARRYLMYVPTNEAISESTGRALLLAFHGSGGDPEQMAALTGFNSVADAENFVVVYPAGIQGNWNDGRPGINPEVDDVGFIAAILDDVRTSMVIDPARIYATGLSNGGHMSFRLAYELGDRIAAIAPVAALLSEALAERGPPALPMPVLVIVGEMDPILPFQGGMVGGDFLRRGRVLSAALTVEFWVQANGATMEGVVIDRGDIDPRDGTRVRSESHSGGDTGADVVLITVENGGHTWPGGEEYLPAWIIGRTSRDLVASQAIWEFFADHARKQRSDRRIETLHRM